LLVLVGVSACVDALASVLRYVHLQSGVDLAIFDQAVWHYSRFQAPFSSVKGEDLLGDHFHPIVALLAPLYWIWADPRTLVVAQAVLVSLSIVPVFLFACDRVGRAPAYLLALAYAVFWGIQVGVLFDFHELAFAPLLIAAAVLLADRREWLWFWVSIVLLLTVKEDMATVVVFIGVFLLTERQFRHGIALIVIGAAWFELATHVLIPHIAADHAYGYWYYGELGHNPLSVLWALLHAPWKLVTVGLSPSVKAHTVLALFAPFLLLSLGTRLAIVMIPLLAERFLATNPNYWSLHFQYSLPIAPLLVMAAAAGLANLSRRFPSRRRQSAVIGLAALILIANIGVTRFETRDSALTQITTGDSFIAPPEAAAGTQIIGRLPAGASVATTQSVLAHVSARAVADPIDGSSVDQVRYLLVNVLHVGCCDPISTYGGYGAIVDSALPQFTPVSYDDGWLLARRAPPGQAAGNGVLTPIPTAQAHTVLTTITAWRTDFLRLIAAVGPCVRALQTHATGATGCIEPYVRRFEAREGSLRQAIHTAAAGPAGGCQQIADAAGSASAAVTDDLRRFATADATGSVTALADAYITFKAHETDEDRLGVLSRFISLCEPRD
jgi:uncharacterized membrane protein